MTKNHDSTHSPEVLKEAIYALEKRLMCAAWRDMWIGESGKDNPYRIELVELAPGGRPLRSCDDFTIEDDDITPLP